MTLEASASFRPGLPDLTRQSSNSARLTVESPSLESMKRVSTWLKTARFSSVVLARIALSSSVSSASDQRDAVIRVDQRAAGKKLKNLLSQLIMAFLNDSLAPFHRVADPRSTHPQSLRQCPERFPRLPHSPIAQKAPGLYLLLLTSLRENLFLFRTTDGHVLG